MATSSCLLLALAASVSCLPPPVPETTTPPATAVTRTNGLINDVKEINLFLNIPAGCDSVYDGLIRQLEGCRAGTSHGDPRLTSGCLLRIDFSRLRQECAKTALFFPAVLAKPTPPQVPCNGTYCETSGKLVFSGAATDVAFPGQSAPKEVVTISEIGRASCRERV